MRVTVGAELWVSREPGVGLVLHAPTVINTATGEGMPGAIHPRPLYILRPGQCIEVDAGRWGRPRGSGDACQACVDMAFGRPPRNGVTHQHTHGPTE